MEIKRVHRINRSFNVVVGLGTLFLLVNLLNLTTEWSILNSGLLAVVTPLQSAMVRGENGLESLWERYISLRSVKEENIRLMERVMALERENVRLRELNNGYARLERLLPLKPGFDGEGVIAGVVGRGASSWSSMFLLNKGTSHGLQKHMVAVSDKGVVGQLAEATPWNSKVLPITDPRSAVDALIQRSRESGIVVGKGNGLCRMIYLPLTADVKVGDRVISSGMGGIFPKGLFIGNVVKVEREKGEPFLNVTLVPGMEAGKLEDVLVIAGGE